MQVCGKKFSASSNLKAHAVVHTGERRFQCAECGKAFATSSHLKTHTVVHSGRRPYQCEICLREFSVSSNLRSHMFIHTGERRHECQVCRKQFTSSSHVKTHMLTHSGERPHKCDLCAKSFAVVSNLKAHRKIHLGQKDHACDVCGKLFYTSSDMKSHRTMHTGERPYQCDVCHERFGKRSNMRAHMLTHTGERPFQCGRCPKRFAKASTLRTHTAKWHPPQESAVATPSASALSKDGASASTAAQTTSSCGEPSPTCVSSQATMMLDNPTECLFRSSRASGVPATRRVNAAFRPISFILIIVACYTSYRCIREWNALDQLVAEQRTVDDFIEMLLRSAAAQSHSYAHVMPSFSRRPCAKGRGSSVHLEIRSICAVRGMVSSAEASAHEVATTVAVVTSSDVSLTGSPTSSYQHYLAPTTVSIGGHIENITIPAQVSVTSPGVAVAAAATSQNLVRILAAASQQNYSSPSSTPTTSRLTTTGLGLPSSSSRLSATSPAALLATTQPPAQQQAIVMDTLTQDEQQRLLSYSSGVMASPSPPRTPQRSPTVSSLSALPPQFAVPPKQSTTNVLPVPPLPPPPLPVSSPTASTSGTAVSSPTRPGGLLQLVGVELPRAAKRIKLEVRPPANEEVAAMRQRVY
ncbi:hypothetical protein HPB51_001490 [Rhipicephalus microplus]|uniref:C2H2-type domain-containing protein n=1 Tax=Rhipicephalus microplus TaxID=6941 RepID=A0A9J6EW64_RHIMP|nr:hypothetical protein HPB51_001490 [Rhipicephalus microplus]